MTFNVTSFVVKDMHLKVHIQCDDQLSNGICCEEDALKTSSSHATNS